jgi:hypothetical protein
MTRQARTRWRFMAPAWPDPAPKSTPRLIWIHFLIGQQRGASVHLQIRTPPTTMMMMAVVLAVVMVVLVLPPPPPPVLAIIIIVLLE